MSFIGSSLGYYGGGPFGIGGGLYGMPIPIQDFDTLAPDPSKKVKPEDGVERTFITPLSTFREFPLGFDKAPPLSMSLIWKMRRFSAIVLAFAAMSRQILSGTQTVEVFNKTADPDLAAEIKAAAEEDLLPTVLEWLEASLECLHFGNQLQEVIWSRKNGRTAPTAFRPILPGYAVLFQDIYGQLSGFQVGGEYRDARYALLSVNQPHIHPIAGYSRNENCREEYWRIMQSELNGDKTENKASDRQMVIKWPMGLVLTDEKGNKVFGEDYARIALNASVRGDAMLIPRFLWDQAAIKNNPSLAEIEPVTVEAIDWGNIGPSLDAQRARIAALKTDCQRAWSRPERESTESQHGSKADSYSAADLGTSDSEAVAAERMREYNKQVFDRWAVTNFGPNAAGICGFKQSPLADPKQDFLQKQSIAITSDQTTGPGYQANFDQRALAERVGIPLVSEEVAQAIVAKQEQDKADQAQQQHAQAMEAIKEKGASGQDDEQQPVPAGGNGRMKLSADEEDEREDIAARLMEYMRPLELDAGWLELAGDDYDGPGEWKTIQGTHVFMHDGVIMKGPANIQGKHVSQLPPRSQPMSSGDHDKAADEHREAAKTAIDRGEHDKVGGHLRKAKEHGAHAAAMREKNAGSKPAEKSPAPAKVESKPAPVAKAEAKPAAPSKTEPAASKPAAPGASKPSGVAPTDEEVSSYVAKNASKDTNGGGRVPIRDIRQHVAATHGQQFAGEHLDKQLKGMHGDKLDLVSANDPSAVPAAHRDAGVKIGGGSENTVWAKPKAQNDYTPRTAAASQPKPSASAPAPAMQSDHGKAIASATKSPMSVDEAHGKFKSLLDDIHAEKAGTPEINAYLGDVKNMAGKDMTPLLEKSEIFGAAKSKADAIDRLGMSLKSQQEWAAKGPGSLNRPAYTPREGDQTETWHATPKNGPLAKEYQEPSGPKGPIDPAVAPYAKKFNDTLAGMKSKGAVAGTGGGNTSTGHIDSVMQDMHDNLSKDQLNHLAEHLGIAGKSASKAEAIDKMRTVLRNQAQMTVKTASF